MGIIAAIVAIAAGAISLGARDGVLKKGADTTVKDTYAFERNALELALTGTEKKQRTVVQLNGDTPEAVEMSSKLNARASRLQEKLDAMVIEEKKRGWDN
jgi:hypothetical protein